ncbi:MAG: DNA polymerase III subunit delta [Clostridiales bacterium]|nr:DNA polymerase III subunit delta [Clostridiales bacterium]
MYRSFINDLKNEGIGNLYLLYGSERFLLDKAVEELKNKVVGGFPEINLTVFEDDTLDITNLANACNTLPFGSDRRLILVKDYKGLVSKSKKSVESIDENGKEETSNLDFIFQLSNSTCLVFVNHGDVDGRKRLFKSIKKAGRVYKFDRIDRGELIQWIKGHFKRVGKNIKPSAIEYFADNIGYLNKNSEANLYHVQNEINKVLAYAKDDSIVTEAHLKQIIKRDIEKDIFKLIDACWQRDISKSLRIYNELLLSGESSFGILAMISKGIKNLIQIKELRIRGLTAKEISKTSQIHEYTVKLYLKHVDKMSFDILENAFNKCINSEINVKTGKINERLSMEMLLTSLFF